MSNETIESFEMTKGGKSGDLLSTANREQPLKVGLLTCGYFEYWRMYDGLAEQITKDMQTIADNLSQKYDLFYPGLVDTLDKANDAGMAFKEQQIDVLIVAEGTYCPDFFVHQALIHLNKDISIICFASQAHRKLAFDTTYDQSLRNSGPMGLIQLTCGFRKMGKYENYEVVAGAVDDPQSYQEIDRLLQVFQCIKNLSKMTIGTMGHVFRGMYDFNFDITAVNGKFGPHIMDIQIDHLMSIFNEIKEDDKRIAQWVEKTKKSYAVSDLTDDDIARSAKLGIALWDLIDRYKLDGLVLLGQHFIEVQANASCYLGLAEILSNDRAIAVTEGDVIGCVMSKVMKDLTGSTAFFGEWEEMDMERNAVMLLGHGFIDPRMARKDRPVKVSTACENWGFQGNSVGFEATYEPGPITMTHAVQDTKGWRILISEGELLDTPPLTIKESSMIVKVEMPIKEYFKKLMRYGFSHHSIAAPGHFGDQMEIFARQLGLEVCRL